MTELFLEVSFANIIYSPSIRLLVLVPLVDGFGQRAAQFVKLGLVVDHFSAAEAGDRVVLEQEDGFLGTDFFAQAAIDAADHVDVEGLRRLLDLGKGGIERDFTGLGRRSRSRG